MKHFEGSTNFQLNVLAAKAFWGKRSEITEGEYRFEENKGLSGNAQIADLYLPNGRGGEYRAASFDFCNDPTMWYQLAEEAGMTIDIKGQAAIPKKGDRERIVTVMRGELGRAVTITYLKSKEEE